ncbi:cysteine--tRNA ligase [Leptolyngbya sp. FACHB-671]|uniref:cysteine--tRNA ligase n=1 Tax=Leptolyngbya sp. FACHB-671 TaxID=2692812 RepID=UPI0016828625|nr:cysteine--tRNA ligase [Leptolyngbya sp. FACHB-671]MBD2067874.1 cysteine--tRNA ligase [Leptolyngbya sp. FACHB-671]
MPLKLYNTLTRHKESFEPLEPGKVRMYCCGVTVYDYCHLGHARSYIVWDTVRRYLQWRGYDVRYVQNFTDIDDKILNRARQEGSTMQEVAERYTQSYFEDMARLNILEADAYPRATHTLDGIKRLIHELEQKGYAYPAEGDVYYTVRNFPEYGRLSGRRLEDMKAGASGRVEADPEAQKKQDPSDFALWKAAKPGEPAWESPWGEGRPGWHIECSAMVREAFRTSDGTLADTIDIHVGGADLVFPHHENEIAQSEAVTGKPLAQYWLHNGMVNVGGEKMSKSLGNFTTIRQLLDAPDAPDPMALRLFVLQAQYRKPIDFTEEAIASAKNSWETLQDGLLFGYQYGKQLGWTDTDDSSFGNPEYMRIPSESEAVQRFQESMDDDFNTPGAIAILFELAKALQKEGNLLVHQGKASIDAQTIREQWQTLVCLAQILGLEAKPSAEPQQADSPTDAEIEDLIQQRQEARKAKNFAESDRIRDELKAKGIILVDQPGGITTWHRS